MLMFSPQCDGTDLTAKVQEMKLQCLLFLNIPRYAEGGSKKTSFFFLLLIIQSEKPLQSHMRVLQVLCWYYALGAPQ